MRRLFCFLAVWAALIPGRAQTRSYSDNASKTFVLGLDSYFFGNAGSLDFRAGGSGHTAVVNDGTVAIDGTSMESGAGDTVIGIHDFTGNGAPELVVGRRSGERLSATVYSLSGGRWKAIGRMGADGVSEIRIFRQVLSIRRGEALCSWTWHGSRFDFKASDGSADPTPTL
ncbi:MAG: hypothetical protein IJ651_06225 [Bacteroidales bacterium]|nr:hypothetical protein [Bacteroidales bacterium]